MLIYVAAVLTAV